MALTVYTGKLLDRIIDLHIKDHLKNAKTHFILIALYLVTLSLFIVQWECGKNFIFIQKTLNFRDPEQGVLGVFNLF